MLISTQNRPAISNYSAPARPKSETKSDYTFLAPGDAYVPSQPNAISVAASGSVLGALAGGGIAALLDGFGGLLHLLPDLLHHLPGPHRGIGKRIFFRLCHSGGRRGKNINSKTKNGSA